MTGCDLIKKKYILHLMIIISLITLNFTTVISLGLEINQSKIEKNNIENLTNLENDEYGLYDLLSYPEPRKHFVPGQLIVKFKERLTDGFIKNEKEIISTGITSVDKLNSKYCVTSCEKIFEKTPNCSLSNVYVFTFPDNADILTITKEYSNNINIEYAEPNYFYYTCTTPNDPLFSLQWPLHNTGQDYPSDERFSTPPGTPDSDIDASEAWDIITGDSNVTIAILDTGVDYTHPDIVDNIWINNEEDINHNYRFDNWPSWQRKNGIYGDIDNKDNDENGYVDDVAGWQFYQGLIFESITISKNDPMDKFGHGTHCAGIAAASTNNNIGIAGVSWNAKIMPIKISVGKIVNIVGAVRGIIYAVDNGADVISMSFGGQIDPKFMKDAVDYAYEHDVVLVAAAGNNNIDLGIIPIYPACYNEVISVAATDSNDEKAPFSNYGFSVDVAAPGVDILSLRAKETDMYPKIIDQGSHIIDDQYYITSGTSMACPCVSGIVALILSKNPNLTPMEIKTILRSSTDEINSDEYIGTGRINVYTALEKASHVIANFNKTEKIQEVRDKIKINGSAFGDGFQRYIVEYGEGIQPKSWIEIKNSTMPIENNTLAIWNTSNIKEGIHRIRLKVICIDGSYYDNTAYLVNNVVNIYHVDDDHSQNNSIKEILKVAGTGDTIYVYSGIYNESIIINRGIKLIGEDSQKTIINNNRMGSPSILETTAAIAIIDNEQVHLENFTIKSIMVGVFIKNATNCSIKNNIIKNSVYGILLFSSYCNNISDNSIKNSLIGIGFSLTKQNIISYNIVTNNQIGCFLYYSNKNAIFKNEINNNKYGITILKNSISNSIKYNNITHNTIIGIQLVGSSNLNLIQNNNFIKNTISAKFKRCGKNYWENNYWDRQRIIPKPISGRMGKLGLIPWLNFDWHPAKKPNGIN